ncbi:hypothetical protein FHR70_000672 [Microvirga lupini]|uniref:Uncharacterized protein n=1 Tax=Microvirga lupini TaxID=420324 RepID=A0A7W4YUP6_9HYPH|nr:hypothetical protein [Microvirga lupini]MBB3017632.1 hypothetical protein [Microvirga lupini]
MNTQTQLMLEQLEDAGAIVRVNAGQAPATTVDFDALVATGPTIAELQAEGKLLPTKPFIIGKLHHGRFGKAWFELADEEAGVEGNTFDSERAARSALVGLGTQGDVHRTSAVLAAGCKL